MTEKLIREYNVKIQKAKSKRTMNIVESYNKTLAKRLFYIQDTSDLLLLHLTEKFYAWIKNLPIIVEDLNNSIIHLIFLQLRQ